MSTTTLRDELKKIAERRGVIDIGGQLADVRIVYFGGKACVVLRLHPYAGDGWRTVAGTAEEMADFLFARGGHCIAGRVGGNEEQT